MHVVFAGACGTYNFSWCILLFGGTHICIVVHVVHMCVCGAWWCLVVHVVNDGVLWWLVVMWYVCGSYNFFSCIFVFGGKYVCIVVHVGGACGACGFFCSGWWCMWYMVLFCGACGVWW